MTIVEDMLITQPKNTLFMSLHPSILPTRYPRGTMPQITVIAVTIAACPTVLSFVKLNSRPSPNIRNTIPILAQVSILSISTTVGSHTKFGLMRNPARM